VKVKAYICDYKNHLVKESATVGITLVEDMFDREASFPTNYHPEKCDCHYCVECYKTRVLIPAQNQVNRKKDEHLYELKVKELAYAIRSTVVSNYREKLRKSSEKGLKKS